MKTRHILILAAVVALVSFNLRSEPAPPQRPDRPVFHFIGRVLKWAAMWYVVGDAPPQANYEAQPTELVNAPPQREIGSDGFARLHHGDGF